MSIIAEKIKKYETFIDNLSSNIGNLNSMSGRYERAIARLECYKEILSDLKQIQSRNNAAPITDEFISKK